MPSPADTKPARKYDIAVLGATGFTGRYICEHLVDSLPTDCAWAIAGRSSQSLDSLRLQLHARNSDRAAPAVECCTLRAEDLNRLACQTKILITAVGPYAKYGTPVMEACIMNGTHYFDVTGETPWVYRMVKEFDAVAKDRRSIVIPQIGIESAPADMLSWCLVSYIKRKLAAQTGNLILSVHDLRGAPSGGTMSSLFSLFDSFALSEIAIAMQPRSLSPLGMPETVPKPKHNGLLYHLFGVRTVPVLGVLTTSFGGAIDSTQVYRSHGLIDQGAYYGPNFSFQPYMRARNLLTGVLIHLGLTLGMAALCLSPVRALLKLLVHKPGQGPSRDSSKSDRIEYRAIAYADSTTLVAKDPKRAIGRLVWEGSMYQLTGVLAAEGAITLLCDETLATKIGGGILTPSLLGDAYVNRLRRAGVFIDIDMMP